MRRVMKQKGGIPALLLILGFLGPNTIVPPRGSTVTVLPTEIHDILYNPGMGFADFHFGLWEPTITPQPASLSDGRLLPLVLG